MHSPRVSVGGPGGRAGVRLLLRLLHTRHRQRAAAAQAANAGSDPWPELQEPDGCDVVEDEFEDVWDLEEHWCVYARVGVFDRTFRYPLISSYRT